ncbi:unnamed protein product [Rotaria sp. Silwood2]|nr:unnamed protein product [Rotaria sp. Silwood2]CAF4547358.1 unnamed protein product [Rotaria sp. Silwood2]
MSSFEPVVLIYGSPADILHATLSLPVPSLFAFDLKSLENIVNLSPQMNQLYLHRYFLVLLQSIDDTIFHQLQSNHRIIRIYKKQNSIEQNFKELNQMANSFKQLTLDITNDIIQFLTHEGEKQLKLERISLVKIYYQQARILKEWMMTFFKAEPCHILLISLNSTQENLDNTQQGLQTICENLGYNSPIIRQFHDYLPSDERHSSLLPYSKLLFNNENPENICRMIKDLSPIRLYLYGNELKIPSEWSNLMIENEKELIDDEENWICFIENDFISNEIKWNFSFLFGKKWQISRVTPLDLNQLNNDPRFVSALRRSFLTYSQRQIQVTADIFDWYEDCVKKEYIKLEPKLNKEQIILKSKRRYYRVELIKARCVFSNLCSFEYLTVDNEKSTSITFIWLDELINDSTEQFKKIIEPFQWNFVNNISSCVSLIEKQLRQKSNIFLIVSGKFGEELFLTTFFLIQQVFSIYIYCAQIESNLKWSKGYLQIKGVYDNLNQLERRIEKDYQQFQDSLSDKNYRIVHQNDNQLEDSESVYSIALTVYNKEQASLFWGNQRTIDTLLSMPHSFESKKEMMEEFRRIYKNNRRILDEINLFDSSYDDLLKNSHVNEASIQWYTKDCFVSKTINKILRSNDVDRMFKFRHILTDIYQHLNMSYKQNHSWNSSSSNEIFYRGQLITNEDFDYLKQIRGSIISMNTFLSTTKSIQVALMYAGRYLNNKDMASVVFIIEKDPWLNTRPFANISHYSLFPDEEETLFSMGCIFKIGNIRQLTGEDNIWTIHLKMLQHDHYLINEIN